MTDLTKSIRQLDKAFIDFRDDNAHIEPVIKAADHVIATIGNGQKVADQLDPIEIKDAIPLVKPVRNLNTWVKKLLGDMKIRRLQIQTAKACTITHEKVHELNHGSQKLIDTVHGKLKAALARAAAKPFIDGIKKLLDESEAAFSAERCVNED